MAQKRTIRDDAVVGGGGERSLCCHIIIRALIDLSPKNGKGRVYDAGKLVDAEIFRRRSEAFFREGNDNSRFEDICKWLGFDSQSIRNNRYKAAEVLKHEERQLRGRNNKKRSKDYFDDDRGRENEPDDVS